MSAGLVLARAADGGLPAAYGPLVEQLLAGREPVDLGRCELVEQAARCGAGRGSTPSCRSRGWRSARSTTSSRRCRRCCGRMRGRAILADEVGLGKTIEAGLVLSELRHARSGRPGTGGDAGRAGRAVARGTGTQVRPAHHGSRARRLGASGDRPVVLASLAAARRDPLQVALTGERWDLVIADEAHRLRNPASASGKLARALRTRYLLLLTATPVENRLAGPLRAGQPGRAGTAGHRRAVPRAPTAAPTRRLGALRNVAALRARTREVMVRHRRSEVAVLLPQRLAETVLVTPWDEERELYAEIAARIRARGPGSRRRRGG